MEIVPDRGARMCKCRRALIRANQLAKIPPQFAGHYLTTLEPENDWQREVIAWMRSNPTSSLMLAGNPGTGKTLLMWLLYREIVKTTDRRVVAMKLTELLREFYQLIDASKRGQTPTIPRISADALRNAEVPYSIFLDDIDKARPTEYAAEQFFEITDAVYEHGHQLVTTTNLSVLHLADHFDRADERYGAAVTRRLVDGAKVFDLFGGQP